MTLRRNQRVVCLLRHRRPHQQSLAGLVLSSTTVLLYVGVLLLQGVTHGAASSAGSPTTHSDLSEYFVVEFVTPHSNGSFQNMVVNWETQNVYIGATDHIYSLGNNLELLNEAQTGPELDNQHCPSLAVSRASCKEPLQWTNNYNKVLLIDYNAQVLITCGSLFHGICSRRDLTNMSHVMEPMKEPSEVVGNTQAASAVAFIAPGPPVSTPQPDAMYVAVTTYADWAGIPSVATRNLRNFSLVHHDQVHGSSSFQFDLFAPQLFPVHYVYGFGSSGYSYFLTRQKRDIQGKAYVTVATRVCQNDKQYHSYIEVPLSCRGNAADETSEYSMLTAARLSYAGRDLAQELGVSLRSDILYAVFSKADKDRQSELTGESALCLFTLESMTQAFTKVVQTCFSGNGSYGGNHLGKSRKCTKNMEFTIDENYCGESESNHPLMGLDPIVSQAVLKFPTASSTSSSSSSSSSAVLLNALQVDVPHGDEFTVAFVGTTDGRLMKISLDKNSTANIYETVSVSQDRPVMSDLALDEESEHLYVLTDRKLVKMKVHDCARHTTCTDCLGAKDPYCGWCSLENKCSLRSECQATDVTASWLSYTSHRCPQLSWVNPEHIQLDKNSELLTVEVLNLPDFHQDTTYQCQFSLADSNSNSSSGSSSSVNVAPLSTTADLTKKTFQCNTPPKAKLPAFEEGQDSVTMRLSILVNSQELVFQNIVFFDCGVHKSCTACTLSQNACSWCIKNHLCTGTPDKHCNTDDNVLGLNTLTPASENQSRGPDSCPSFLSLTPDSEILVGSGTNLSVRVRAKALKSQYQMSDLQCRFVIEGEVQRVFAHVDTENDQIICQTLRFHYLQKRDVQRVPFQILWGGANNALDNPDGVSVIMYKCPEMAKTCGDCFIIHPKYKCGWCNNERCSTTDFCQAKPNGFLQKGSVCPDALITEFEPKSGPLKGGTLVTIYGQNLGISQDNADVTIRGHTCAIMSFKAPSRLVCKTPEVPNALSHQIKIEIGRSSSNQVIAESKDLFSFVQPTLTAISPDVGVIAGGAFVTLTGEHLDAGSNKSVFIGQNACINVKNINATALACETSVASADQIGVPMEVTLMIDDEELQTPGVVFKYATNPNITWLSRHEVIQSGGLSINVSGESLQNVQNPKLILWYKDVPYTGACQLSSSHPSTNMTCLSPNVSGVHPEDFASSGVGDPGSGDAGGYLEVELGFLMDAVQPLYKAAHLGKVRLYPDPVLKPVTEAYQPGQGLLILEAEHLEPLKTSDVRIQVGQENCVVKSVAGHIITCEPPATEPAALEGSGFPEVLVFIGEHEHNLGTLPYEGQEDLSREAIIGILAAVVLFIIILVVICLVCLMKVRRNDDMMKKMKKEMDQLESRVANECKDAFAELQTDMSELQSDLSGGGSIPFWDYRTYCMRVLFPTDCNEKHPVIRELELDYHHREDFKRGLKRFFDLIRNKTFLLILIRTLESNSNFLLRDRVNVASLISVTLQTHMDYATEILKTLLADLIEKTVGNQKGHPRLLLRRNESVAEKMLTNWFTFLLYKFLKECAGQPLFFLYGAIKQQVSKGPVDAVTGEARYSLSEDKLIRQHINYRPMVLQVMDVDQDRCQQPLHPVKVLDCDTISQVKEKILDTIYKSAPFTSRPPKEELDLVLFEYPSEWMVGEKTEIPMKMFPNKETKRLLLSDEDHTTKSESDCKRLNTLSHYKVPDGAYVALHPKQTSIYNMSFMSEKSKISDNSFYNHSPLLSRSMSPQNVNIDVEGCKVYHLVRTQDGESKEGERGNKMVTEIYLPRLLVTKGTLETFVDDLFERIFSTTHRSTVMPLAIKYMFDFLDDQAMLHGMPDDVVHTWKSNSLPLRFWVNVIKNPNFAFDIYKSNIVDACLTVIGQTFMDCCSTQEHKLTKESPSAKLLYAKDIPKYKQWVASYYQNIKIMPAISDQDMLAMLAEESRAHQNEFNTNAALLELWKYVKKYYDEIVSALEDDEFAKKNRLMSKLDEVCADLESNSYDSNPIC